MLDGLVGRPVQLPPDLVARFPELREVRWRRGGLPPRVAGWFLGRRSVSGITLWNTVWLGTHAALDPELLLHELMHVAQFQATRTFPVRYLWESLRRGYHRNRFEVEARDYASARLRGLPVPPN
jgi:hypothetical protein